MLTEEEKRKIEEKRLRAKAIREEKLKEQKTTNVPVVENNKKLNFDCFKLENFQKVNSTNITSSFPNRIEQKSTTSNGTICNNVWSKSNCQSSSFNKFGSKMSTNKAKTVLISRTRFELVAPYCQKLIEVVKNVETAVYNAEKKRWSFHLKAYNAFIKAVEEIKGEMAVEGLPNFVARVFSNIISTGVNKHNEIPTHDLRNIDKALLNSLFPFQLDAINFAISKGGRALIADDMGLGKTIEALGVASYYRDEWPLLIITPAGVRHTWVKAIHKFYSHEYVSPLDVFSPNTRKELKFPSSSKFIVIVSYDMMKSLLEPLAEKRFRVIILDESHFIKDSKTERSKAAVALLKTAQRVILLSGTPALSRPAEIFSQVHCINKNIFSNFRDFAYRYCDAKMRPTQFGGGLDASGASNLEELEILLKESVMIRRLKDDVMNQLQPKCRNVFVLSKNLVELDDKTLSKARENFFDEKLGKMEKRGALLKFFNETARTKVNAVSSHILGLLNEGRKMVVFAHHQLMMDSLHTAIVAENFHVVRIDGSTTSEVRQKLCDKFQSDDEVKVALLSITAASTGLTLTAASLVVFAELFWNPGVLVQAEDRVHRVGQESDVEIQYLVAKGTADDEIWNLVKKKLEVLGKGGLSKDNFDDVSTVVVKSDRAKRSSDDNQTTLDDFWDSFTASDLDFDLNSTSIKLEKTSNDTISESSTSLSLSTSSVDSSEEPKSKRLKSELN